MFTFILHSNLENLQKAAYSSLAAGPFVLHNFQVMEEDRLEGSRDKGRLELEHNHEDGQAMEDGHLKGSCEEGRLEDIKVHG
jgi:hypothetical protein